MGKVIGQIHSFFLKLKIMIGILADSHDNLTSLKKAILIFNNRDCKLVIHAGDFVAPFAARELKALNCEVRAVFGNCDGEKEGLRKAFSSMGEIHEAPLIFDYQGLKFLVTHLDSQLNSYLASEKYEVIIFAHTHRPELRKIDGRLLINPGEAGGWLTGRSTIALFDPKNLSVEIAEL